MMPVPSCAGCISTRAAPQRPFTTWCRVPFFSLTLNNLRRASSMAFCTATGTSRALPLPMPMPPSPSPTTVSAATVASAWARARHAAALHHLGHAVDRDHLLAQTVAALLVLHPGLDL